MTKRTKLAVIAVVAGVVVAAAAGIGIAAVGDSDTPLMGNALDRATEAALASTGGGEVIDTEVGDDGAAYGVEIRQDDGSVVEVNLDENFEVIGSEPDEDTPGETEDGESS